MITTQAVHLQDRKFVLVNSICKYKKWYVSCGNHKQESVPQVWRARYSQSIQNIVPSTEEDLKDCEAKGKTCKASNT